MGFTEIGLDEWIKSVCEDATTALKVNGRASKASAVLVGVYQGSVLSLLLFIIVLEALFREFISSYFIHSSNPMELLYADDLVLMAGNMEMLIEK